MAVLVGKEREHNFQPGDNVEVCEGELINLQGRVLSVDGNKITIMPKHEDLKVGAGSLGSGTYGMGSESGCPTVQDPLVFLSSQSTHSSAARR